MIDSVYASTYKVYLHIIQIYNSYNTTHETGVGNPTGISRLDDCFGQSLTGRVLLQLADIGTYECTYTKLHFKVSFAEYYIS